MQKHTKNTTHRHTHTHITHKLAHKLAYKLADSTHIWLFRLIICGDYADTHQRREYSAFFYFIWMVFFCWSACGEFTIVFSFGFWSVGDFFSLHYFSCFLGVMILRAIYVPELHYKCNAFINLITPMTLFFNNLYVFFFIFGVK